jgi:hypothetical protein
LPLIADRNFIDGTRFHRRERRFQLERHEVIKALASRKMTKAE